MSEQSGVSSEVVPLPRGGGATRSIGETFSPDLHTGTGNYRVPLWFPRGPAGFQPSLALVYSTGGGNGPFGIGWLLPVMQVTRRTDRGLPSYQDDADTFLLDQEELVPVGAGRYRHRREVSFKRVERSGSGWEVRDRGGRRYLLGMSSATRIEDTTGGAIRTYTWLLERAIDRNGNEIAFSYHRDAGQLYLAAISYGIYTITFDYEQRPDPRSDRRAGFAVTTALRCTDITYRLNGDPDPIFRRYSLAYLECPYTGLSQLASIVCTGHRQGHAGAELASLPALRFGYTSFQIGRRLQRFEAEGEQPPPLPLSDPDMDMIDLYGTGLPGVIQLSGPIRRFWANRGGRWGPPQSLRDLPAAVTLADRAVAFADMNGDGTADLLTLEEPPLGYYRNEAGHGWTRRTRFRRAPQFDPSDPELRFLDLNGDGLVDAIRTSPRQFYLYYNRGDAGWDAPVAVARSHDAATFPDISFGDPRTKLADLNGDGLVDVVWVHGGRLDYWPHYGHARFGPRVSLALAPMIGPRFDPERLFLADINGDGLDDVVYVEADRVRLWVNQGGRALVSAGTIQYTPPAGAGDVQLADLGGTGTWGLVWSSPASRPDGGNYRYIDLAGGVRPYLLTSIDEGTGLVTEIEYTPSTEHARQAAVEGRPWQSTLPFPVQIVARITQHDSVTGAQTGRSMRYFDGFFDGQDREFRGFGRVEALEQGVPGVPATLTISSFYQGHRDETPGATHDLRRSLVGRLYRQEVYGPDGTPQAALPFRIEENTYTARVLEVGSNGRTVVFPHLARSEVSVFERTAAPRVQITELEYDDFGNVTLKREHASAAAADQELVTAISYTADTTSWLLNLPVEVVRANGAGQLLGLRRFYYDGPAFVGLPSGQATLGNLVRREDMVLTETLITQLFSGAPPDLASLGYHRMGAPGGVQGWGVNGLRQAHDAHGNVVQTMDALGAVGQAIFDPVGIYQTRAVDPLGHVFDITYDIRSGEVDRLAEPNGHETRYHFDAVGRVTAMVKPGDSDDFPTAAFEYLDAALPLGVRTRLRTVAGTTATLDQVEYFDGSGRAFQRRSAAEGGRVIVDGWRRYNARGWEAERSVPFFSAGFAYIPGEGSALPRRYTFSYDALGRVIETVTPDGRPARTAYGPGTATRYDVSDTDASSANVARGHFDTPRTEEYDAADKLLRVIDRGAGGMTQETRYVRDLLGNLEAIIDARGVQTSTYVYDLLGRVVEVSHVDAGRRRMCYNARGGPAFTIDAAGRRTEIRYDALGRQLETLVDGARTERYSYDAGSGANLAGRLARVEDEAGTLIFSYTPRGLIGERIRQVPTQAGQASFSVSYTYDSLERMTSVTGPDGAAPVMYRYSDRGLLERIDGFVDAISYNELGQRTETQYANGVRQTYTYDQGTFYLDRSVVVGPTRQEPYYDVSYAYDAVGNPLSMTDGVTVAGHPDFQRQFSYDPFSRLTGVSGTLAGVPFSRSYRYDAAGNFHTNEEFRSEELTLVPGTNQLRGVIAAGAETPLFSYDPDGNLARTPDLTLNFDARGRLTRVVRIDGLVAEYVYGYNGGRVRKRVTQGGVVQETIYIDGLYRVDDGQATHFVFNEHELVAAMPAGGTPLTFHRDHLGHTVLLTDAAGAIAREVGSFPFGTAAYAVGSAAIPYNFMGNELDPETGFVYARSRYYDPRLGRFISPDLFLLLNPERVLVLPGSLNLYAYAANNPIRLVDDEGSWWKWLVGGLIIAALVVATVVVGIATGGAGFAFGILLAASIGSALGSGVGVYAAHQAGGDLADGFLFGALVGAAAGAAGYALGAAVGAAGIGGIWGSILSGAAQGAIVGAGNGAIIGYGGGVGSLEEILTQAAIGFGVGAVFGGIAGAVSYARPNFPDMIGRAFGGSGNISEASRPFWTTVGRGLGYIPQVLVTYNAIYTPTLFVGLGSVAHAAIRYQWSDIQALCPPGRDCVIPSPSISWDYPPSGR